MSSFIEITVNVMLLGYTAWTMTMSKNTLKFQCAKEWKYNYNDDINYNLLMYISPL